MLNDRIMLTDIELVEMLIYFQNLFCLHKRCIFAPHQHNCTRSLMDKMLDSGSDDGGSSPFGCTKFTLLKCNILYFLIHFWNSLICFASALLFFRHHLPME